VAYVTAEKVRSPKAHWYLFEVILDRGEGNCAYALGEWEGERRIGFRWNGSADNPIGNPQSRGLPTWTMLDPELHRAVISLLPPEKRDLTLRFLRLDRPVTSLDSLEDGYRAMAADEDRERAAAEWAENLIGDIADERR
jgi:hypothetical protein